ncbi:hypothetical protein JD969_09835 [Planctomycetota bacterium]|nr:hypothetical protein JD969_09835 [Planctomycetota bacterium]
MMIAGLAIVPGGGALLLMGLAAGLAFSDSTGVRWLCGGVLLVIGGLYSIPMLEHGVHAHTFFVPLFCLLLFLAALVIDQTGSG